MKSVFVCILFLISLPVAAGNVINVKNYGAAGNGKTDDTRAIQSAIDAASPSKMTIIYFPSGTYNIASFTKTTNYLENYSLLLHSNLDLRGEGTKTVLRVADHIFDKKDTSANAHLFYGRQTHNISFSNLMIDLNGANNLIPENGIKNHSAIFTAHGSNYHIFNLTVKNSAANNMIIIMGQGKNLVIEDCKFLNGGFYVGTDIPNKNSYDFSFVYTEWDSTIVRNNIIKQENIEIGLANNSGGIELHGSNSSAIGNIMEGCWPAIFITSSRNTPMKNVKIQGNIMHKCIAGITFWLKEPMENISITDNTITLTASRAAKQNLCTGIMVPNGNAKEYSNKFANGATITHLTIADNTITGEPMQMLSAGMILHSLQDSYIFGNTISGMTYSGIVLSGSKWGIDSLVVRNNKFSNFRAFQDKKTAKGYIVITDTYSKNVSDAPGFKNIEFSNNQFLRKNKTISPEKYDAAFIAAPASSLREIKISNNYYEDPAEKKQVIISY